MPPYSLGFIMKSLRISCQLFLYHTILECAAEKYKTCSIKEADHLTITLKALFQAHSNDTILDRELFERAVKQVILQPDASVQLRLLNDIVV